MDKKEGVKTNGEALKGLNKPAEYGFFQPQGCLVLTKCFLK
jgi:hypothetical protein